MFYSKKAETVSRGTVAITVGNYFAGAIACVLLVIQLCHAMLLCVEIPVSFSDGEYAAFFWLELGILAALTVKLALNLRFSDRMRHGKITAGIALIVLILWIFFFCGDLTAMASPLESAFRGKVLLMDGIGIVTALGAMASQLVVLLRGRIGKKK